MSRLDYSAGPFHASSSSDNKRLYVTGPFDLHIEIDHDDVDQETVQAETCQLVRLLASHWPK